MVLSAFSQVKIGEMVNGNAVVTHDMQDIIQALEKEYDINQGTQFNYASIYISLTNNYWLVAGNGNPANQFKIAVQLDYNSTQNEFYVSAVPDRPVHSCVDCSSVDCHLIFDGNGNLAGCSECNGYPSQHCNHSITMKPANELAVVRYLIYK